MTPDDTTVPMPPLGSREAIPRDEMARYARHLVLPEVGVEGQERLKGSRVLIVGAGGLGSPVALYLAAAGVGTLGLVDFDEVDASNLQRQILHGTADVGRSKLESARDRIGAMNPHVRVVLHEYRLTTENALDVLAGYDVVVDGTDNFPTRYLVNDACVLLGKPNVYGSVLRWEGQLSVFAAPGGPCYRCLFREPPPPGLVPNCAEGGVLGVLPGIIGSLQALETLKLLLGTGDTMIGRLLIFNALELTSREIQLRRNPECPVCGDAPTQDGLIDYEDFCGVKKESQDVTTSSVRQIDPTGLAELLSNDEPPFLLDVREPHEWGIANLEPQGAVLIPMGEVGSSLHRLPRDRSIVVHCRSGARSNKIAEYLLEAGFTDVVNLAGGILAWADDIDPAIQKY